jgi:hypothetical protein
VDPEKYLPRYALTALSFLMLKATPIAMHRAPTQSKVIQFFLFFKKTKVTRRWTNCN